MDSYLLIKSLHVIFVITWFAGLFYIVRLFVYQAEAKEKPQNEKEVLVPQYKLMAKRLWYGIAWPSMILTLIFGLSMLYLRPGLLQLDYMQIKLGFVGGLIIYHFSCHIFFKKLQSDTDQRSGTFYRVWNEVATLFLVAIIFLIIMRNEINWIYGILGFVALGILLMIAIKLYKRWRENK